MKCPVCEADMIDNEVSVGESYDCHDCGYSYDSYERREHLIEHRKRLHKLLDQIGKAETEH